MGRRYAILDGTRVSLETLREIFLKVPHLTMKRHPVAHPLTYDDFFREYLKFQVFKRMLLTTDELKECIRHEIASIPRER